MCYNKNYDTILVLEARRIWIVEQRENGEVQTLGWDAITKECERVYPDQKNPKHYGTLIKWCLGGKDPLDGISI